jgi:hypothetical protein
MVDASVQLVNPANTIYVQAVMDDLLVVVEKRLGARHDAVVKLQTGLVNNARFIGPSEGQIETTERIIDSHLANGNVRILMDCVGGVISTRSKTMRPADAVIWGMQSVRNDY